MTWNVCPVGVSDGDSGNFGTGGPGAAGDEACSVLLASWSMYDVQLDMGVFLGTPVEHGDDFYLEVDGTNVRNLPSLECHIRMLIRAKKSIIIKQARVNANIVQATFSLTVTPIKDLCCREG